MVDTPLPAEHYDGVPDAGQRALWEAMDETARRATLDRLEVVARFMEKGSGLSAADAAKELRLKVSRFYKMVADWKATGSIEAMGTVPIRRTRRSKLQPGVVNALQKVVPDVVAMNIDMPISHLVDLMVVKSGMTRGLPSKMKLREIVETEKRRLEATTLAGNSVAFDCCALSVARDAREPFVVFAVLDRGTRAWLGYALAPFEQAKAGYAEAAAHAASRLAGLDLPWTRDVQHLQITAGADLESFATIVTEIEERFGIAARRATNPKRFGGYLRDIIGPGIGPVRFASRRTTSGPPMNVNGKPDVRTEAELRGWLDTAIDEHNRDEIAKGSREASPPGQLLDVLGYMSSMSD